MDLAPGFVDVQVNGGGGVLFNDTPDVDTLRTIAAAHGRFGTTSLLPTFITDSRRRWSRRGRPWEQAREEGVPGILGVHFEGPFLDPRKTGAHDRGFVRGADEGDLEAILGGAPGVVLVTAAACALVGGTLARLLGGGARVALGHCASTYEEAKAAFDGGVTGVTHLFNAMCPMESRAPGLVGAAARDPRGDERGDRGRRPRGIRCAPGRVAGGGALGPHAGHRCGAAGRVDLEEFELGGQRVRLDGLRCVNEEGNLAGSALDMATAVRNCVRGAEIPLEDALHMASYHAGSLPRPGGRARRAAPGDASGPWSPSTMSCTRRRLHGRAADHRDLAQGEATPPERERPRSSFEERGLSLRS